MEVTVPMLIFRGPDGPLVHHPHNYTWLYFLDSLGCLEYGIDRYHWKFWVESDIPKENVR